MATYFYYVHGKKFEERDEITPIEGDSNDIFWVHVVGPEEGELELLLEELKMSEAIIEMLVNPRPHPEVLVSEGSGACSFPIQMPGDWSREYLTFAQHGRNLLTTTTAVIPYIEEFRERAAKKGAESEKNPMAELLEACGRADRSALQAMRTAVDAFDERVEEAPETIDFSDIRQLKRAVIVCGNICEDQAFCLAALDAPAARELSQSRSASVRKPLMTLVRYVDRSFDRLDVRARELEAQLQMFYSRKTEDRLRMLTIISAIFMPLTLIAGIYGMNFEGMPELDDPYAYQICLGAMAVLSVSMLGFFYRRGWFAKSR